MGESISADILAGLEKLIARILGNGKGVADHIALPIATNSPYQICGNVDRILPALTIINNGTATVNIGSGGVALFPLVVGASYTWRWKNPKYAQLVFNDLGTIAIIDVIS